MKDEKTQQLRASIAYLENFKPIPGPEGDKILSFLKEYVELKEKEFVPKGVPGEEEDYDPTIIDTDNALELVQNFKWDSVIYRFRPTTKNNLFVDMDGTIAHWRNPGEQYIDIKGNVRYFHQDDIYDAGYFYVLPPEMNVLNAVKEIISNHPEISVYILSSIEKNSESPYRDKSQWLNKYLPELPAERRIFTPCGKQKIDYLNLELSEKNVLLDDYTRNLQEFTIGKVNNIGVKVLNGINDTHGSWQGARTDGSLAPEIIASQIVKVFDNKQRLEKGIG